MQLRVSHYVLEGKVAAVQFECIQEGKVVSIARFPLSGNTMGMAH